jgi:signal transduction histidine kinase
LLDADLLVREAVELLVPAAGTKINIMADLPMIWAERVPFHQIVLNLIGNCAEIRAGLPPRRDR